MKNLYVISCKQIKKFSYLYDNKMGIMALSNTLNRHFAQNMMISYIYWYYYFLIDIKY